MSMDFWDDMFQKYATEKRIFFFWDLRNSSLNKIDILIYIFTFSTALPLPNPKLMYTQICQ